MVLPARPTSTCPLKPTRRTPSEEEKKDYSKTTMDHHNHHHIELLHFFPGQNLHYQRHPPSRAPPAFEQDAKPTTDTLRVLLRRGVDTATTVTIPPVTNHLQVITPASTTSSSTTSSSTTSSSTTSSSTTSSSTTTTNPTFVDITTAATATPVPTTSSTAPKINTNTPSHPSQSSSHTHTTAASRHEIILLALGIFILVAQLALIIWVGVRRRRFSSLSSSSSSSGSGTCAYHPNWHRENCPRELNGLQLDGRVSGCGSGSGGGLLHVHGKGREECLWREAFGESPTSPGGWRARGLRVGEGVEGGDEREGEGDGSGYDVDEGEGEGERERVRSRGNSVVIAGAQELVERVRKRSNSLGTFLKRIGAGKGQHVQVIPEEQKTVTRKRSNTFTMGLGRRTSGGGETGLRERKGSAATATATATTTAREGDVEMGVGRTSGLSADFGGKFDGTEEQDGGGSSERRRGSWVQVLRRHSGLGNQFGVQDPEKGGYWY